MEIIGYCSRMQRTALLLLLATAMFGMAAALVAQLGLGSVHVTGWALLGGGVGMCSIGLLRQVDRSFPWKVIGLLALLNATQLGLYMLSLGLAPVSLAASLHLTAPIWLLLIACLRRQRPVDRHTVAVFLAILAGLLFAAVDSSNGGSNLFLGLLASLGSAMIIALMLLLVKHHSSQLSWDWSQGITQLLGFLILLPLTITGLAGNVDFAHAGSAFAIGLLLYAPGGVLVWIALSRLPAATVSSFSLMEAVFAAIIAFAFFSGTIHLAQLASMAFILLAVYLEVVRSPKDSSLVRAIEM